MARKTSIETYHEIQESGLLSRMRWVVYSALFRHGPCVSSDLARHIVRDGDMSGTPGQRENVCARLNELREMGVVEEVGEQVSEATGKNSILWDVNDQLPKKHKKPGITLTLQDKRNALKSLRALYRMKDGIKDEDVWHGDALTKLGKWLKYQVEKQ